MNNIRNITSVKNCFLETRFYRNMWLLYHVNVTVLSINTLEINTNSRY